MIAGIGVDVVDIARFESSLERTPALRARLFTEAERTVAMHSLAARFAAKEALIKALGGSEGFTWHGAEVVNTASGAPQFAMTPELDALLQRRGLQHPHLSLSHDGGMATAFVVIERSAA